jgi:HipA-like protein
MRSGQVFYKNELAGILNQLDNGRKPAISLTLPKNKREFTSSTLFPFFFNLIPEGVNKRLLCSKKRIDFDDYFGILLEVAGGDTIGAVSISKAK